MFGRFFVRLRAVYEPGASVFHQRHVRRLGHQLQRLLRRHIMQCQRDVAVNIVGDDNIVAGQSRQPRQHFPHGRIPRLHIRRLNRSGE